jgi:hypothetical protein
LFLFESDSQHRGIQLSKPIINNQQSTDKAGSPRRLKIMKNDQTLYGILADSEEKGRGAMETAVYATCILSVVAAIFQFVGQTDARSVRWVRPGSATHSGCFTRRATSVADEILTAVARHFE